MGNGNSRTITSEDGTATMTHYVQSDCYWFNPFCDNHSQAETFTYFGNNSPNPGATTYSTMFGSYSSNMFLASLGSFTLLICLVALVISIRRRRQEAYLYQGSHLDGILGVNYSPDKVTSGSMEDLRLNNNDQLKIEQIEHWSVTPNNNLDDSDEEDGEVGGLTGTTADPSKARYKYQLKRLYSLKSHQITTPERYISVSELKFDNDFNEERGKPKRSSGFELV